MRWSLVAIVLVSLTAGTASAATVEGALALDEPAEFHAPARFDAVGLALYVNATEDLDAFTLSAERVVVHTFYRRYVEVPLVTTNVGTPIEMRDATYTLTNVTLRLADGSQEGWLGVYPSAARFGVDAADGALALARADGAVGNSPTEEAEPDPRFNAYAVGRSDPHVLLDARGAFGASGDVLLKIEGLDVDVRAAENATIMRTGIERSGGPGPRERTESWLFLDAEAATVESAGDAEVRAMGGLMRAAWNGELTSTLGAEGELRSDSAAFHGGAGPLRLAGDLSAVLSPETKPGGVTLALELTGELSSSNLARVSVPLAQRATLWPWIVLAVALVAGAGSYALLRRSRALDFDDLVELGHLAMEADRPGEALGWFQKARRLAPTSAALALDEAFCHEQLGEVDAALATYAVASGLSQDGEADLSRARLILRLEGEADPRVEPLLLQALDRTPELVFDVEELVERPSPTLREAMRRAEASLGKA